MMTILVAWCLDNILMLTNSSCIENSTLLGSKLIDSVAIYSCEQPNDDEFKGDGKLLESAGRFRLKKPWIAAGFGTSDSVRTSIKSSCTLLIKAESARIALQPTKTKLS